LNEDITSILYEFRRKQRRRQIAFAAILLIVLGATLSILFYIRRQGKKAEVNAETQRSQAERATQALDVLGGTILEKTQSIDRETLLLSGGHEPTLYVWRGGLTSARRSPTVSQLVNLLTDRKSLLADSGPVLGSYKPLADYVCDHIWYVVGESTTTANADRALQREIAKDPRFRMAEVGERKPNGYSAIRIGFFLSRTDANALASEVGVGDYQIRRWNFGQYQPNCTSAPTMSN
jgi:hypothetical protein